MKPFEDRNQPRRFVRSTADETAPAPATLAISHPAVSDALRLALLASLFLLGLFALAACGRGAGDAAQGGPGGDGAVTEGGAASDASGDAAADSEADSEGTAAPRPTLDRSVDQVVTADGELRFPELPQPASFSSAGRLTEMAVAVDDEVLPGQVLARIDDTGLRQAVAEARAGQIAARLQLTELERGTELERARLQFEQSKNSRWGSQAIRDATCGRVKPFFDQASCDQSEANVNAAEQSVQLAELAYKSLQQSRDADLAVARTRLQSADLSLARAETSLESATLTAPITATVTELKVLPGVDVAPGTPVMTLVRSRPLRFVTANLGERYIGNIRPGDAARVTLTAHPDRALDATVYRIDPQGARDQSGAMVFTVYLDMAEVEDLALYAGMTGRVEITVGGGGA